MKMKFIRAAKHNNKIHHNEEKINNKKLLENIKKEYENLIKRIKTYSFQELKKIYK